MANVCSVAVLNIFGFQANYRLELSKEAADGWDVQAQWSRFSGPSSAGVRGWWYFSTGQGGEIEACHTHRLLVSRGTTPRTKKKTVRKLGFCCMFLYAFSSLQRVVLFFSWDIAIFLVVLGAKTCFFCLSLPVWAFRFDFFCFAADWIPYLQKILPAGKGTICMEEWSPECIHIYSALFVLFNMIYRFTYVS